MTTERTAAANTGFASGGVTCTLGALCFYSSSVQVDSFMLRNPPERKARNPKPLGTIFTGHSTHINHEQ